MIIDVSCCDVPWTHVNFIFYRYYISACVPFSAWKLLTLPQVEYPLCKKCAQAVPKRSQWAKQKVDVMKPLGESARTWLLSQDLVSTIFMSHIAILYKPGISWLLFHVLSLLLIQLLPVYINTAVIS